VTTSTEGQDLTAPAPPADPGSEAAEPLTGEASTEATAPAAPRLRGARRRIAVRAGSVLVAMAIGAAGGLVELHVVHDGKDGGTASAASASASPTAPSYGAKSDGSHFGDLKDLLAPVPGGDSLGPDDAPWGSNTDLTPSQVLTAETSGIDGLTSKQRAAVKKLLTAERIRGAALRTYDLGGQAAEIMLLQANQKSVKFDKEFDAGFAAGTNLYRTGPAIPGHPSEHCMLPPTTPGDKLDSMECEVSVGDLLVDMHVDGPAPLDTSEAMDLLKQQLDRIAIPDQQI